MTHTALHEAIVDSVAMAEHAVETRIAGRSAYVVDLLREPSKRDPGVWMRAFDAAEKAGAPLTADDWDVDLDDLIDYPPDARDFHWSAIVQVALSAAQAQFDAERILRPLWSALERGGVPVVEEAANLIKPLSKEAKRGPNKEKFAAAKERIRGSV
jgi:hypothetical protein